MMTAVMEERPSAMARAAAGDADAFALLIEPLLDPAYRLAAVMLSDRTAAEDAVQESSLKAWRKLRQLRGDAGSLRPWFLSIVAIQLPAGADPTAEVESDLHRALRRLSPEERLPLVLHFYLDLPLDEVARTMGISPAATKSRIYRAARRLRSDLTPEEVF